MLSSVRAALLTLCLVATCAQAQTRTLALYVGPARGLDQESSQTVQLELRKLLAPAAVELIWKSSAQPKLVEDFDWVAVSSFQGLCSVTDLPPAPPGATGNPPSLADTSMSKGHIQPFFHVDCDRLVRMLKPELDPLNVISRQLVFGRALARVIAHEIYHILAQTPEHEDKGVAKPAFSLHDLTTARFEFDAWSLARMKPLPRARSFDSEETR